MVKNTWKDTSFENKDFQIGRLVFEIKVNP